MRPELTLFANESVRQSSPKQGLVETLRELEGMMNGGHRY